MARIRQIDQIQQLRHAVIQRRAANAAELAVKLQGLLAAQVFVKVGIFREETDLVARVHFQRILSEDRAIPGSRSNQTQQPLHNRRLPGTVRSDQSIDLTRHNADRHVIDGSQRMATEGCLEILHQVADLDGRCAFGHGRKQADPPRRSAQRISCLKNFNSPRSDEQVLRVTSNPPPTPSRLSGSAIDQSPKVCTLPALHDFRPNTSRPIRRARPFQ